jgi:hypothetical protein
MSTSKSRSEYGVGGGGNVFSDHLFSEQPLMKGQEISEEEAAEFTKQTTEYSVGAASNSETDRLFNESGVLWGVEVEEE